MKSDLGNCPQCGIDLVKVFGDANAKPKAHTFICAETAEITVTDLEPFSGPARCLCGVDLPAPKQ